MLVAVRAVSGGAPATAVAVRTLAAVAVAAVVMVAVMEMEMEMEATAEVAVRETSLVAETMTVVLAIQRQPVSKHAPLSAPSPPAPRLLSARSQPALRPLAIMVRSWINLC